MAKEISDLKNSLDFMNTTVEELQKDIAAKSDKEVFEKFELEIREILMTLPIVLCEIT